jgi:hypothetical protein
VVNDGAISVRPPRQQLQQPLRPAPRRGVASDRGPAAQRHTSAPTRRPLPTRPRAPRTTAQMPPRPRPGPPYRAQLPAPPPTRGAHTHAIPHLASRLRACLALRLLRTSKLRSADTRRVLLFEHNERRGDIVRGWVQVARDRRRAAAAVSVAEEGEVDGEVGGGLCCDAGGDEVRAEAEVCAQRAEEEGFFGGQ